MPVRFVHKKRSKITYSDKPMFLDIETSHNHDPENPICWIVSIQVLFDDAYHLFRTPEEFIEYITDLSKRMKLSTERRLVIYIHNASYDLSYLLPYIQKYYPGKEERHCIMHGEHKIIQYYQGGLEFRCSYLLSGVSLERWSKEMNVEHQKQVGLYDYDAIIYQDSELDIQSLTYDEYDVLHAIAHLLYQCRGCMEDHYDDCLINVVRSALEVIEFGEEQSYEGDPISYMFKIAGIDADKANIIRREYLEHKKQLT